MFYVVNCTVGILSFAVATCCKQPTIKIVHSCNIIIITIKVNNRSNDLFWFHISNFTLDVLCLFSCPFIGKLFLKPGFIHPYKVFSPPLLSNIFSDGAGNLGYICRHYRQIDCYFIIKHCLLKEYSGFVTKDVQRWLLQEAKLSLQNYVICTSHYITFTKLKNSNW